jgi:hypothetical protein
LQKFSKIDRKIAWVGSKCLFRSLFAKPGGLQVLKKRFADISSEALELPAHCRFMNAQHSGYVMQFLLIEKIAGEQEPIFLGE